MSEAVEVRLARVEEKLSALDARLEANHATAEAERRQVRERLDESHARAEAERLEIRETLSEVVASLNKWAGVRAGLLGIAAFITGLAGVSGALAAYVFHKP